MADPGEPAFRFEPLDARHDREAFSCGIAALDNYLRKQARQDARKGVAVCIVLTPDGKTVAGYFTLSQFSIELAHLPEPLAERLPRYPQVPCTLVGRLAVSTIFRGQGLGELILMNALERSLRASHQVAAAAVIVDAKDVRARSFYLKYGFIELPAIPNRLFLPMATIEQLFA